MVFKFVRKMRKNKTTSQSYFTVPKKDKFGKPISVKKDVDYDCIIEEIKEENEDEERS